MGKRIILLLLAMIIWGFSDFSSFASDSSWRPQSTERLVKLPSHYLEKSITHDFNQSNLGKAVRNTEEDIGFKVRTLSDLQTAVELAEGEMLTELRHRLLVEKQEYLELSASRIDLRREELLTKRRLF